MSLTGFRPLSSSQTQTRRRRKSFSKLYGARSLSTTIRVADGTSVGKFRFATESMSARHAASLREIIVDVRAPLYLGENGSISVRRLGQDRT